MGLVQTRVDIEGEGNSRNFHNGSLLLFPKNTALKSSNGQQLSWPSRKERSVQ